MKLVGIYGQKKVESFNCDVYPRADGETRAKVEKEKSEAYLAIEEALYDIFDGSIKKQKNKERSPENESSGSRHQKDRRDNKQRQN